jgi:hypothetical protein
MRDRLLTIMLGLVAGVGGALVVGAHSSEPPAPSVVRAHDPSAAPIVPPGWDRRTLVRVASVEAKVDKPAAPEVPSERDIKSLVELTIRHLAAGCAPPASRAQADRAGQVQGLT